MLIVQPVLCYKIHKGIQYMTLIFTISFLSPFSFFVSVPSLYLQENWHTNSFPLFFKEVPFSELYYPTIMFLQSNFTVRKNEPAIPIGSVGHRNHAVTVSEVVQIMREASFTIYSFSKLLVLKKKKTTRKPISIMDLSTPILYSPQRA